MFGTCPYAGTYQHLRDTVYAPSLIDRHPRSWEPSECAGRPVARDDLQMLEKGLRMGGDVERDLRDRQGTGVSGAGCRPARVGRRQPDLGRILGGSAGDGRADAVDRLRHRTHAPEDTSQSSCPFTPDPAHAFDGHVDDPRDLAGAGCPHQAPHSWTAYACRITETGSSHPGCTRRPSSDGARDLPVHACVPAHAGGRDGGWADAPRTCGSPAAGTRTSRRIGCRPAPRRTWRRRQVGCGPHAAPLYCNRDPVTGGCDGSRPGAARMPPG